MLVMIWGKIVIVQKLQTAETLINEIIMAKQLNYLFPNFLCIHTFLGTSYAIRIQQQSFWLTFGGLVPFPIPTTLLCCFGNDLVLEKKVHRTRR